MERSKQPIVCPECGAAMNHHADKLAYAFTAEGAKEVLQEFHRCPTCGAGVSRRGND